MVRTTVAAVLAFAALAMATGVDPAGEKNFANGKGLQFIFGRCKNNSDCASGCCAGLGDTAVCSGPAVGNAAGKRGCGFPYGGAGAAGPPPADAPVTPPSPPADTPAAPPADAPPADAPPADAPPADAPPADAPPADAPPTDAPVDAPAVDTPVDTPAAPADVPASPPPPPAVPRPAGCPACPAGFQ